MDRRDEDYNIDEYLEDEIEDLDEENYEDDEEEIIEEAEEDLNDLLDDHFDDDDSSDIHYHHGNIKDVNLTGEMKTSFLDYAMSVIVSRALPDVRDGLKPVHRRILYAMGELNLYNDRAYKKSARIVGDVIGKYHPHGDSAVYDALVRMAQDFSFRYPLVDGHGNFGSIDGDSAAAMRYTEARMSKIAGEMLRDLNKNTVNFINNYDGSEREPEVLPSRFPNLLVNGTSGIAVGMATNIPPHNLSEVIDGVLALIEKPDIPVERLIEYIPAPDFPTGGIVSNLGQVKKAYLTGSGSVTIRAKTQIVKMKNREAIIITEIPYQVNKTRLIERIADIAKKKIIDGIIDLRDESNRKGIRIVMELRRDANAEVILNNLFKYTQLQTSFGINLLALDRGQPKVMNLKEILSRYIEHQIEVITRRTQFDLDKAKNRLHIVEGLLIALANIDEVIAVIKSSQTNNDAVETLISRFLLTEIQAKAILDMKLARLTGLEVEKLADEQKELSQLVQTLEAILADENKKMDILANELTEIQTKYGSDRQSVLDISGDCDLDISDEDLIPEEDVIITITNRGYIKRMNVDTYRTQRRGGKGKTGARIVDDDFAERVLYTSTHDYLLFFTNFGKVYVLKAYQIPAASRIAKGLPIVNLLSFDQDESLAAVINLSSLDEEGYIVFATKLGMIKKTEIGQYKNIRSTGIKAIILNEGDELISVALSDGTKDIILGSSNGKAIRFSESVVRPTNRAAMGVKGIKLDDDQTAIGMAIVSDEDEEVLVLTSNGYGKRTKVSEFRVKGRNGKGVKCLNLTEKNGVLVCLTVIDKEDDLIVISDQGMIIRTHLKEISTIGRDTQGVKIITLSEGQIVASMAIVPHNEEDDEEEIEEETIYPNLTILDDEEEKEQEVEETENEE
ncbi:MAG: DNA gyrase subunit A [Bacilli bacterium]|jgi:DNA gyrase subunit A